VTKSHLAAKVPESDKFALFWKLIWKENIKYIILLDNRFEDDQVIVHPAKLNSSRLTFIGNS
jgi:protein tyrosine phosphatase